MNQVLLEIQIIPEPILVVSLHMGDRGLNQQKYRNLQYSYLQSSFMSLCEGLNLALNFEKLA